VRDVFYILYDLFMIITFSMYTIIFNIFLTRNKKYKFLDI